MSRLSLLSLFLLACIAMQAQQRRVKLFFAGDAMQHQLQINAAKQGNTYIYTSYFKHIEERIKEADLAIVNLEAPIGVKPYRGYPAFSSPPHYAEALQDAGFDILLLANNHILDKRKRGLERTIHLLDSMQIMHTGAFLDSQDRATRYPLMMRRDGIKIAMLNYTYGTNGILTQEPNIVNRIDTTQIKADIAEANRFGVDIIIANMHWGEEYKLKHNKSQTRIADFLIRNGVRLVIGNHPHVVQPFDVRRTDDSISSVIVYSLGNLVSNMQTTDTRGGMLAYIEISKKDDDPVKIESFDYSLIWTHKVKENGVVKDYEVLPVELYNNEAGAAYMGKADFAVFSTFVKHANETLQTSNTK